MKTNLLAIVLGLGISTAAFGQTPILSYGFNGTGSTVASTGSDTTSVGLSSSPAATQSPGLGVSGAAGDGALNLETGNTGGMSTGAAGPTGGYAIQGALDTHLNSLYSFTLTGWFQTAGTAQINGAARLIDASSGSSGFYLAGNAGELQLAVSNGGGGVTATSAAAYATTQNWVYFAVTYTGSSTSDTGTVNFYEGTIGTAATLVSTTTINFGSGTGEVANPLRAFAIGNINNGTSRPFDGLIDDISVYGTTATDGSGALTLAQIDAVQALAIPEPATYGLFGFALLLLGIRARGRLRAA